MEYPWSFNTSHQQEFNMTGMIQEFQVFIKPSGSVCNLACSYCYYLDKESLYPRKSRIRMPDEILEEVIVQHIEASDGPVVSFSWHGGEPTILGLDYFKTIVELQNKHRPSNRRISNGIQTNGTLLNEEWCRFFSEHDFSVGISLDGPQQFHDHYRTTRDKCGSYERALKGYRLLQEAGVATEILCVVNDRNVSFSTELYRFFKELDARYISFLPLVNKPMEKQENTEHLNVPADAWGQFLCTIFDEWITDDIGRIKVQIFEEAIRPAFKQKHTLCIFKKTCGRVPVIEHNGDFFSCDHFVDSEHFIGNILDKPIYDLLESTKQTQFGRLKLDTLPQYCLDCEVRDMCNGGCPKNRFIRTPDGEFGLNYLCRGYQRFFNHCKPFVTQIADLWQQEKISDRSATVLNKNLPKTGRNDPCPCGSGKKYKNCCLFQ